ncbi:MAG: SPASM domain-containing protein [Clostridia bacterium]|nr:SPASM domain-containing protein [Clostridia bacterium]
MTIHLIYKNYLSFQKQFKAVMKVFPKNVPTFYLHLDKRPSLKAYFRLKKRGFPVVYCLHVKALSNKLISLANRNKLTLVLLADSLSKKDFKKTDKLKTLTVIKTEDEQALEKRNLLVKNSCVDQPFSADVAELCLLGTPIYQCAFSSCLGKTLYVDARGEVSFCPERIEETKIGNLFEETPIFERPTFISVLEKQIEKREQCKKNCSLFSACHGGCALTDTCAKFREEQKTTVQKIDEVVKEKKPLSGESKLITTAILRAAAKGNLTIKK